MRYIRPDKTEIEFTTFFEQGNSTIFNHFKNKSYMIITMAKDSNTNKDVVVYRVLYGDLKFYTMDAEIFFNKVDRKKNPEVKSTYIFEVKE